MTRERFKRFMLTRRFAPFGSSQLLKKSGIKRHMCHINVIPLNPTEGFDGKKSDPERVKKFRDVLEAEFGVRCTVRVRRGIDVEAGCGQLHSVIEKRRGGGSKDKEEVIEVGAGVETVEEIEIVGGEFAEDFEGEDEFIFGEEGDEEENIYDRPIDLDADDFEEEEALDPSEASRILDLISTNKKGQGLSAKTKITDEDEDVERKIKKLKKKLKSIERLQGKVEGGLQMDDKMREKLRKKREIEGEEVGGANDDSEVQSEY